MSSRCSSVVVIDGDDEDDFDMLPGRWKFLDDGAVPSLRRGSSSSSTSTGSDDQKKKKPTKLLLNVNVQNGLGPVHVVMSPENTVGDLIKAVMELYVKEKRRPLLPSTEPNFFQLHYSPFILEGIKTEEKLENLDSRNFFLCPKA